MRACIYSYSYLYRRVSGFTLLEAMTALVITALLTSIAIPSFANWNQQQMRASAVEQLVTLFALTRSTAVKTGQVTWLCGSSDGSTCIKSGINTFILFVDTNNNHRADAGELISSMSTPSPSLRYQTSPSTFNSFQFKPDGRPRSYGNVVLCPSRDNHFAAKVIVSNTGRLRHARDRNGDGIIEGSDGGPQVCP